MLLSRSGVGEGHMKIIQSRVLKQPHGSLGGLMQTRGGLSVTHRGEVGYPVSYYGPRQSVTENLIKLETMHFRNLHREYLEVKFIAWSSRL